MDKNRFSQLFALGSHLCREPMPPMSELKHDMELLKKNGFNLVKLQEHWMVDEPLEGQLDFSRYEELIEHAAGLDLGVYLGLTCEQAPGWLYLKYPDARMVGRDGRPIVYEAQTALPADGKPGPCFDHPGALADQNRFIHALVNTLGRFENIVVWNTWQEIGYWPMLGAGQPVCYCEHTLSAFRKWLEGKYGDLDGLNRAWNTRYGDWSTVQPDRGAYQQNGLPHDVDWRYFMDDIQVANVLRSRAAAIKETDPFQRPVFAHKGGISLGQGLDWVYARCQDFMGSSCYPAWNAFHTWDDGAPQRGNIPERIRALTNEMVGGVALTYDVIRSCNPPGAPLWAAEFQGGPVNTFLHKGRVPSPADLRRWMLTAVSAGVTAISFWVTRAEIMAQEMNGFSLLDSTGETSARLGEAARVGSALNRHADLFAHPSWGGAEVGILVNEWNAQLATTDPPAYDHLSYSTRGWHRLLWDASVPVDFVEISYLAEKGNHYKVLIAPFPLSISDQAAEILVEYVSGGGLLICEAAAGRLNEHNVARRGELSPTLAALCGARHQNLQMVREPSTVQRWMPVERTWGEFLDPCVLEGTGLLTGARTQANLYLETFILDGGEQILTVGGQTAGTLGKRDLGKAILIGTLVGHNGLAYQNPDTVDFVRRLLDLGGVKPLHNGRLLKRVRQIGGQQAWFFTNSTGETIDELVEVGGAQVEDLLGLTFDRSGSQVNLSVAPLDVRVLIVTEA